MKGPQNSRSWLFLKSSVERSLAIYEDVKESSTGPNPPNGQSSSSEIQYNNCNVNVYNPPAQPSFSLMIPYGPPPSLPFDHYYISEGSVSHINGVWPVFLLKLAKFKAHWSNFITCSRCGQPPLYKSPITSPRWPFS